MRHLPGRREEEETLTAPTPTPAVDGPSRRAPTQREEGSKLPPTETASQNSKLVQV